MDNKRISDDVRPAWAQTERERIEQQIHEHPHSHCYDAEKCNAETFCDCPCARCMRTKRGEYQTR